MNRNWILYLDFLVLLIWRFKVWDAMGWDRIDIAQIPWTFLKGITYLTNGKSS